MDATVRNIFVLGYTGETGNTLLPLLAKEQRFQKIRLIGRRMVELPVINEDRFEQVVVDFEKLEEYQDAFTGCDTGICCLGTTRGKVGSANFVRVDRDYVAASGRVSKAAGCQHFIVLSSGGSNKDSSILYTKTKGEMEELLKECDLPRLTILRPGLFTGPREEFRCGERFIKCLCLPCAVTCPASTGTIHINKLARAMFNVAVNPLGHSVVILLNKDIHKIAAWK
ncbi:oxidoreductase HTATIP2-like [Mya arenaria]|nr:oxidoreductase HTATIP2-like [Mya arenaria]